MIEVYILFLILSAIVPGLYTFILGEAREWYRILLVLLLADIDACTPLPRYNGCPNSDLEEFTSETQE